MSSKIELTGNNGSALAVEAGAASEKLTPIYLIGEGKIVLPVIDRTSGKSGLTSSQLETIINFSLKTYAEYLEQASSVSIPNPDKKTNSNDNWRNAKMVGHPIIMDYPQSQNRILINFTTTQLFDESDEKHYESTFCLCTCPEELDSPGMLRSSLAKRWRSDNLLFGRKDDGEYTEIGTYRKYFEQYNIGINETLEKLKNEGWQDISEFWAMKLNEPIKPAE